MNSNVDKRIKIIELIIATLVLTFCEWFFFRNVIGNQLLIGDRADGRLTNLLTEHWWNFFNGKEKFDELAMFFPAEGVLGYTDLFVGYGIIYSVFRLLGINMFISFKYTLIVVHIMGTITMYYLMRKTLGCRIWWALFGTIAFSFSDTYSRFLIHSQLAAISALPLLTIFLVEFIRNFEIRKKRNIYAYALIVWFVLLTYNSWYVACFAGVFALFFLVVYFVVLKCNGVRVWPTLSMRIKQVWKDVIGYIIVMGILYIPFIKVYIPVLKASSGYSYSTCTGYLPEFADIVNVSTTNWFFGTIVNKMQLSDRGYSFEVSEGFSVVLLLMFVSLMIIEKNKLKRADEEINLKPYSRLLIYSVFFTVLVAIISIVRLSSNGISLWLIVYTLVPVVRSMRAVARFWLWLSFPMAVIVACAANKYIRFSNKLNIMVPIMFIAGIFITNMNNGVMQMWDADYELSYYNSVAIPPEDAEVFYIIDSSSAGEQPYMYQLDAYEIADKYGIKTINGYSGQMPSDWNGIWEVSSQNYESNVFYWCNEHQIDNVYAYDKGTNTWEKAAPRFAGLLEDVFKPCENKFSLNSGLEDHNQGEYCWTSRDAQIVINNGSIDGGELTIEYDTPVSYYLLQNPEIIPYIELYIDGLYVRNLPISEEHMVISTHIDNHPSNIYTIELKTNCYFVPNEIGTGGDGRSLSVAIYYIGE